MITRYAIIAAAALLAIAGSYRLGRYTMHRDDLEQGLRDINAANLADAARVRDIDIGTTRIDVAFHATISYQVAVQTRNVEEQNHAIDAAPSLLACVIPADVLRLRREQVEASRSPAPPRP